MTTLIKTGRLPKIKGAGSKPRGSWSGHDDQAAEVKRLGTSVSDVEEGWACLQQSPTRGPLTRIAKLINDGKVVAFRPDDGGTYEASTRQDDGAFELWVRYVPNRLADADN